MFPFDNTYAALPGAFYRPVVPSPVKAPQLICLNTKLAEDLGLDPDQLNSPEGLDVLSGNRVPEEAVPIAMAYSGHQFGGLSPQLGDGRAILLGEVIGKDGVRKDIPYKLEGRLALDLPTTPAVAYRTEGTIRLNTGTY